MAVVALVRAGAEDCWDGGPPEDMIIIIIILLAVRWLVGFQVKEQDRSKRQNTVGTGYLLHSG
jgi:hypothetical protein